MSPRSRRSTPSAYGAAPDDDPTPEAAVPVDAMPADAGRVDAVPAPLAEVEARDLLRTMLLIRRFEERCVQLYSEARIRGFMHVYIGEEAVAAGIFAALDPDDAVVSTYREHGHALARGIDPSRLMAEMFGVVEGCSRGRGGSMHIFDAERRFYGGNGIVAGGLPIAVGLGLADHLRGTSRVTACFFGEGAVAEGEFHECMNLASLWRLPILFCCENNLYAMGTALDRSEAETDLALKASSYRMPSWRVDGMDALAVLSAARAAVESVRGGGGPVFLELQTYRFRAHSMYDPELYRDRAEVEHWKERDPIAELVRRAGLLDQVVTDLDAEVTVIVDDAVRFADSGHLEAVDDLLRYVTSEVLP
jgi:pyruvate dehydrogenase E1 component alpha subunit